MPWESRYTRDELAEAVRTSKTTAEVLRKVGLVPRGGNYEWIRTRFARWNIDASHLQRYASRRLEQVWDFSDADIARAVEKSPSLAAAMRELGRKKSAAGYRYLHEAIQRLELDTSHMTGSAWSRGRSLPQSRKRLSYFLVKGRFTNTAKLRERLIEEGLRQRQCEMCRLAHWQGQPIPLELDHINGDRTDNRLENLRLLCPNCHALTPTYRGRNIGRNS